jgi:hypothetical protein
MPKTAKERAPVTICRGGYLPYFGKQGVFWACFFEEGKISILRGFPGVGKGTGLNLGLFTSSHKRGIFRD